MFKRLFEKVIKHEDIMEGQGYSTGSMIVYGRVIPIARVKGDLHSELIPNLFYFRMCISRSYQTRMDAYYGRELTGEWLFYFNYWSGIFKYGCWSWINEGEIKDFKTPNTFKYCYYNALGDIVTEYLTQEQIDRLYQELIEHNKGLKNADYTEITEVN